MGPLGEVLEPLLRGIRRRKVWIVGGSNFEINKIKEREHSNKWDPSERFFKEPLLWGINYLIFIDLNTPTFPKI